VNVRAILVGAFIVVISFVGASAVLKPLWPSTASLQQGRPALVAVPPLRPLTGTSTVLAPDKTLRVIANATGAVNVAVSSLSVQ
jgi:hypothetical protein